MQTTLARIGMFVAALVLGSTVATLAATSGTPASTVVAQASPTPAPKATPNPFSYDGYVRAFYFTRQNASNSTQGGANTALNQTSFNSAIKLHGEYKFGSSPVSLGASYVYANPLGSNGACDDTVNYGQGGTCQQYPKSVNNFKMSDTTLPGFVLSSLTEAYLKYKDKNINATIGDQVFNSPWANASDSRVKAAYFQGVDANANVGGGFSVGISRMTEWEARTSSQFNKITLITPLNADGTPKVTTNGFLLGKASYAHAKDFVANLNYYQLYDIAQMMWLDGKYTYTKSPLSPYLAMQFGSEKNTGAAIVGLIDNQTWGAQLGANFGKNVSAAFSYDTMPWKTVTVTGTCAAALKPYWAPAGGTANCQALAGGQAKVYYGGIAAPYTDSYATDPLYTTSISQGMADRRSAGNSWKFAITAVTNDKKLKAVLSRAGYDYSTFTSQKTDETNVDVTYFFNKVVAGPYHGFQLRHRYAERSITSIGAGSGLPLFKYNRTQLEYDF